MKKERVILTLTIVGLVCCWTVLLVFVVVGVDVLVVVRFSGLCLCYFVVGRCLLVVNISEDVT